MKIPSTPHMASSPLNRAWTASQALESQFISQMLSSAGVGKQTGDFNGGVGEQHFASFLTDKQADAIVRRGGISLAEQIYRSIVEVRIDVK